MWWVIVWSGHVWQKIHTHKQDKWDCGTVWTLVSPAPSWAQTAPLPGKGQHISHYINLVSSCQLVLQTTRDDGVSLIFFGSAIFLLRLSIPEWCFSDRMASQSHSMIENRCKIRMQSSFPDTWSQHAVQPSPRVNQASADTCLIAKYHSQPQFKGLATLQGN